MTHCQETDSIRSDSKNKCVAVGIELTGEYIVVTESAVDTSDTRGYKGKGKKVKQSRYRPGVAQRVPGS